MKIAVYKYFTTHLTIIIFFIVSSIPIYGVPRQSEIDSVKAQLEECSSDTCQFKILRDLFWKSRFSNSYYGDYYGEWAFQVIKNTKNLKILTDGYDIKINLLMKERKFDSATYYLKEALRISTEIGYKMRATWCYYGLGEINNNLGNSQVSIDNLKLARKGLDPKDYAIAIGNINNWIAENFKRLGQFDSAIFYFNQNIIIKKNIGDKIGEIYSILDIGECYNVLKDIKKTAAYLNRGLIMADSLNDEGLLISAYWKIGDFFSGQNNYAISRKYYNKLLDYSIKQKEKKRESIVYSLLGKTYLEEGQDSIALDYILKSYKISKDINYRHSLSDAYFSLGYAYKKLGKTKLALDNFKSCWHTKCDYCLPLSFHQALIEIGDIYLKMKNQDEAFYWYEKSYHLADSFNAKGQIATSLFRFGDYYRQVSDYHNAEKRYLKSLELTKELKYNEMVKSIADTLCHFYISQNNYKTAFKYLKLAREMDDSIFNAEKQTGIAKLEMNFEFENLRKDKELKELQSNAEINKQKIFKNFLLALSLLFIVLAIIIYSNFKRKKKDNQLLKTKNAEIESKIEEITVQKETIEKISEQLHEADQLKINFLTNISHELRTPLTLITSPLIKLLKNNENNETHNLYSLMLRNAKKLQTLINQLLDVSKLDKGELKLNLNKYNLNSHVRVMAAMFQSIAEEKNIDFRVIEKQQNVVFSFDAERVDQILNNLLSNAFKFTPEGGAITLELNIAKTNNTDFAELIISDNGIGIPAESIEKIFDRFYQCDSTIARNFEGSGIGLSLTKDLVKLHGGQLNVKSEPGKYTVFTVLLPMIQTEGSNEFPLTEKKLNGFGNDKTISTLTVNNPPVNSNQKETILIVEDNTDLRQYLQSCLSAKFNVLTASNGNEGIKNAIAAVPDLVISDVMMPEMDGYQLTSKLKTCIETSHIPVILLTAKAGRESKIEGLESGAYDYISKPFDEDELLLKIQNILQGTKKLQEKYRRYITVNPSETAEISMEEKFLNNLSKIIESELSNTGLNPDFICSKINLSHSQVNRKLKALTNLSINQFIRSLRLKRAASLLNNKTATVSEIAYMTGFENLSYFTRKFKEEFGILPSEYVS